MTLENETPLFIDRMTGKPYGYRGDSDSGAAADFDDEDLVDFEPIGYKVDGEKEEE